MPLCPVRTKLSSLQNLSVSLVLCSLLQILSQKSRAQGYGEKAMNRAILLDSHLTAGLQENAGNVLMSGPKGFPSTV